MADAKALILLSSGEPAGIGPDICLMLAGEALDAPVAVLADPDVLTARAAELGLAVALRLCTDCAAVETHRPGELQVLPISAPVPVRPGELNPANADYVLELLRFGAAACVVGEAAALVTAPVQKSVLSTVERPFSGHTEFLAELTGAPLPVMMLASRELRVALATTHVPLGQVPSVLTPARLEQTIEVLDRDLREVFAIERPVIHVLGVNPHAGESGTLGHEERDWMEPLLAAMRQRGYTLVGPLPADTAFGAESRAGCDAILAMYHDQGLPALKALAFGEIVNVTLGLPIIRTSVDHGTALPLAGTGRARATSLRAAVELALRLARESLRPCRRVPTSA